MRLGVLDVGSNTVHLLVVDAHRGARPEPVRSHKTQLRLAELLQPDGSVGSHGTTALVEAVSAARSAAEEEDVDELLAFATSAVRDAPDSAAVLDAVRERSGVELEVLTGEDEARLTFFAARRWLGWSAGRLLCLDIGGGSLELAVGADEEPEIALSVPLGAGRVTRERLAGDPPPGPVVDATRAWAGERIAQAASELLSGGSVDRVVATSKTFRSLARLATDDMRPAPVLDARGLDRVLDLLRESTVAERCTWPGISAGRAHQLLAGAVVASAAFEQLGVRRAHICPWALREGVVLRRLDWLDSGSRRPRNGS